MALVCLVPDSLLAPYFICSYVDRCDVLFQITSHVNIQVYVLSFVVPSRVRLNINKWFVQSNK